MSFNIRVGGFSKNENRVFECTFQKKKSSVFSQFSQFSKDYNFIISEIGPTLDTVSCHLALGWVVFPKMKLGFNFQKKKDSIFTNFLFCEIGPTLDNLLCHN